MRRFLSVSNLQLVQMGRMDLLRSQMPTEKTRTMLVNLYTGVHPKPELGNFAISI